MRTRIIVAYLLVVSLIAATLAQAPHDTYAAEMRAAQPPAAKASAPPQMLMIAPLAGGLGEVINPAAYNRSRGPNLSQRVVLTYDDCPNNLTQLTAVLQFVKRENIGLVLAPTGECVAKFKKKYKADIVQMARNHGQYVINHSRTHPNLTKRTPANIRWQLSGEVVSDYGRPPYGATNTKVANGYKAAKMRQWLWNVDTNDWKKGKTEVHIVNHVVRYAKPGDTVLMHMQHKGFSSNAIGTIQARLRADTKKLELCRAFRGWANPPGGPVRVAPAKLGNNALPC